MATAKIGSFIDDDPVVTNTSDGNADGNTRANGSDATPLAAVEPEFIAGFESFDPGSVAAGSGTGGSGGGGKRRGRPPGSGNKSKTAKAPSNNLSGLESILLSIHFM